MHLLGKVEEDRLLGFHCARKVRSLTELVQLLRDLPVLLPSVGNPSRLIVKGVRPWSDSMRRLERAPAKTQCRNFHPEKTYRTRYPSGRNRRMLKKKAVRKS